MEFLKGFVFGKYYICNEYILEEGNRDDGGIIYMEGYTYPYWRVSKKWLEEYNDPTKREIRTWVENGKPQCEFISPLEYVDHHNFLFEDDACAIGDTPQEALRQYILTVHDINLEAYVRKEGHFVYLNDFAKDKEKWDELFKDVDKFYLYTQEYPYHFESGLEMAEFNL